MRLDVIGLLPTQVMRGGIYMPQQHSNLIGANRIASIAHTNARAQFDNSTDY
jgi:hypothetical protein